MTIPTYRLSVMRTQRGFTLFELAISMIVIGLLTGLTMSMSQPMLDAAKKVATERKLDVIEEALASYRILYGRLPCPSNVTLADSNASFGVEAANAGTCNGGSPAANFGPSNNVVEGGVPVKALGLPNEFANDGWGRRIAYAVWQGATATNGMSPLLSMTDANCGRIEVRDESGNARTQSGVYLLLSYGADGHGGHNKAGTRENRGVTQSDTLNNCNCDASAVTGAYNNIYVQRALREVSSADRYDDLVRYKERWQFQTSDDGMQLGNMCKNLRVDGAAATDYSGYSVVGGDVNGDNIDDLIIGAFSADNNSRASSGSVYVLFGKTTGWATPIDLNSATWWDGVNGVRIDGSAIGSTIGTSIAVGDINSDGRDDIIVAAAGEAPYGRVTAGSVYVFFGRAAGNWSGTYDLNVAANYNGTNGLRFDGGLAGDILSTVAAGDVNGDGVDDIIMGAWGADYGPRNSSGSVYVYFGKATGWASPYDMSTVANYNGTNGARLDGAVIGDALGYEVASGDINGDDRDDIIMNAYNADNNGRANSASTYVFFGRPVGAWAATYDMNTLANYNGTNGVRFDGAAAGDRLGLGIAAGDVNGDGKDDVIMGAYIASSSVYVYFGKSAGWGGPYDMNTAANYDGTDGTRFDRATAGDSFGYQVGVGDVNADGKDDILMGAIATDYNGRGNSGSAYVFFGRAAGSWASTYALDSCDTPGEECDGTNGIRIDGAVASDTLSDSVATGDINGDGRPDIIIGATNADNNGRNASGSVYVYFSRVPGTWPATPVDTASW